MNAVGVGLRALGSDLTRARNTLRRLKRTHRAHRSARLRHRVLMVAVVLFILVVIAAPAFADSSSAGQVWTSWMTDKDSHGNQIGAYYLRVSQGGFTDVPTAVGAFLLTSAWSIYLLIVEVTVWSLDFVLQFHSLDLVRGPAGAVAGVLNDVIGRVGFVGTAVTVSVLISTFWILRGRTAAGFGEMCVSIVIAALIGTVVSNPVAFITGPDGAIVKAQDAGSALTVDLLHRPGQVAPTGNTPSEMVQSAASARILDVMVRTPSQLINYGMTFDGSGASAACKAAYESAVHGHSVSTMADVCPKVVSDTMGSPQSSLVGIVVILPASLLLLLFVFVLMLVTLFLTALAAFEAAVFAWRLVKGIFPGSSREGIFSAACTMAVACGLLIASIVSVGVLVLAINAIFEESSSWSPVPIYLFIDLVMLVLIIGVLMMAFRARKHGKRFGKKAADSMAPKPVTMSGGQNMGSRAAAGARTAAAWANQQKMRRSLGAASVGGAVGGAVATEMAGHGAPQTPRRSVARSAAKLTGTAAKVGLAYTVGAPVAVPRATKAAQSAMTVRKAALAAKLAQSKGTVRSAVDQKVSGVQAYAAEYKHNLGAAARFMGAGLSTAGAAMTGTPLKKASNKSLPTATSQASSLRASGPPVKTGLGQLNSLRERLGQKPLPPPRRPQVTTTADLSSAEALSDLQEQLKARRRVAGAWRPAPQTIRR